MRRKNHYGIIVMMVTVILLVLFLPVLLVKMQDSKMRNKIHVENVSPSRDALLTSLTLEERIALFCSSEANPKALSGGQDIAMSSDSEGESWEKVTMEYSYVIKDTEEIDLLEQELEKMVNDGVFPKIFLLDAEKGYTSGTRFYLYSEEKNQGAVFLLFERYSKNGTLARYIMDEESGKIIGAYLYKEDLREYVDSHTEYGKKFLSYMGWAYDLIIDTDKEQHFLIQGNGFTYYSYLTDYEMMLHPSE